VRYTVLDKLCPRWPPWRQASSRSHRVGDPAPSPSELVANDCFGRVAEQERLALEGLIAAEGCPAQAAAPEPPDEDLTKSVG
jgi:hypothetical protein